MRWSAWSWLAAGMLAAPLRAEAPIPVSTAAAARPPIVLTLPDCIQRGLAQATEVLKARHQNDYSGDQLLQAYLEFLPNLEASANYQWQDGREYYTIGAPTFVRTNNRSANYTLTSTLNVFNGFADTAGLQSGRRLHAAAGLSLYRAGQQIILDITQAYLTVILDRQIQAFELKNFHASQEREDLLTEQAHVGMKSLADLYRQQAQTSADQLAWIQAANRARDDLIFLLRRLRLEPTLAYDIADATFQAPPAQDPYLNESALVDEALGRRPDLLAQRDLLEADQSAIRLARGGYYPRLDLNAQMAGTGSVLKTQIVNGMDVVPPDQPSLEHQLGSNILYSAGAALSWGLFDRYVTALAVARARQSARDAEVDYDDLRLQVEGDVKVAAGDYHAYRQQLDTAARGLKAAKESYDAVAERYKVGASSIVDLLTAQATLVQAQASDAQARVGFTLEESILENVLGRTPVPAL